MNELTLLLCPGLFPYLESRLLSYLVVFMWYFLCDLFPSYSACYFPWSLGPPDPFISFTAKLKRFYF